MAWLKGWNHRIPFKRSDNKNFSESRSDRVTLFINKYNGIDDKNISLFFNGISNRIIVTKANGITPIPSKIEKWDNDAKKAEILVFIKRKSIMELYSKATSGFESPIGNKIYLYYGQNNTIFNILSRIKNKNRLKKQKKWQKIVILQQESAKRSLKFSLLFRKFMI